MDGNARGARIEREVRASQGNAFLSAGEAATEAECGISILIYSEIILIARHDAGVGGGAAVLKEALEPAIAGLAHGRCGGTRRCDASARLPTPFRHNGRAL